MRSFFTGNKNASVKYSCGEMTWTHRMLVTTTAEIR